MDYENALSEVERLWGATSGTPESNRLDVLATRIDVYEAEHYPMQQGLLRKHLESLIGTRTRVAEILNRKRSLSIGIIRRPHDRLGISTEVLTRPSRNEKAA